MLLPAAVAVVLVYGLCVWTLRGRGGAWGAARTAAFVAGAAVLVAGASEIGDGGRTAHALQHVFVGMVAPLLLALGAPVSLALRVLSSVWRGRLRRALDTRAAAVVLHPVVSFPVFAGSLFVLYLTPLYELTERHQWLHAAVHVHFLAAGAVFLWPLVSPDPVPVRLPSPGRVLVVLLTVPAHAVLGVALLGEARTADERSAAAVLWVAGELVGLVLVGVALAQWYRRDTVPTPTPSRSGGGIRAPVPGSRHQNSSSRGRQLSG